MSEDFSNNPGPSSGLSFGHNQPQESLYRIGADFQPIRNIFGREAMRQQLNHLPFTLSEGKTVSHLLKIQRFRVSLKQNGRLRRPSPA